MFVGNLSFETTADDLRELFVQAGEIRDVVVPTDRDTGRPRGFAFVELETGEAAEKAIRQFNGFELHGRRLRVDEASEPVARPGGGHGGRFGADRPGARPSRPKGSRRNIRGRKRGF